MVGLCLLALFQAFFFLIYYGLFYQTYAIANLTLSVFSIFLVSLYVSLPSPKTTCRSQSLNCVILMPFFIIHFFVCVSFTLRTMQ